MIFDIIYIQIMYIRITIDTFKIKEVSLLLKGVKV